MIVSWGLGLSQTKPSFEGILWALIALASFVTVWAIMSLEDRSLSRCRLKLICSALYFLTNYSMIGKG